MSGTKLLPVLIAAVLPGVAAAQAPAAMPKPPVAAQVPFVVKGPQGERVDEYHWMRDDDPKTKRPEILRHLEAENAYTEAVLAPLQPLQAKLVAEMRARIQEDDSTAPVYDGGWWYWHRFDKGAEYPLLLRRRGGPEAPDPAAPEEVLLDQPKMAAGLKYFSVAGSAVSPDGQWLAWAEDTTGRRIHTLRFKNLTSGRVLPESIEGVLDDMVWAADNRTLFYIRQDPVTLQADAVMRHRLGRAEDTLVWREADKTLFTGLLSTASRRFVGIFMDGYETTELQVVPASEPERAPAVVLPRRPGVRTYADHLDGRWVLRTNHGAPNFRLVEATDAELADPARWRDIVPASADLTVEGFTLLKGRIGVQERAGSERRIRVIGRGGEQSIAAPGASVALDDNRDAEAAHLRYTLASLVQPSQVWDLHLADAERLLRKEQPVPTYDRSLYRTARVFAPARDGEQVPVTLAWRADRARQDGTAPLYVTGYGAYGWAFDPYFSEARISLLDRGFVYAVAHVRGGADKGQAWYEAGRLMKKKNSFNDFIDVTDFLVRERWGAKDTVFASGGSAGGLLMGAVANQAGERYRGMSLEVPFVDVVTTMLDATIPLTANEWTQWGDPREKAAHDYMLSYSPYDNLAKKAYPAMLVTTGLWDSQVQYYEPAKYVARLRALKTDARPLLLHVNMSAGHGGASGRFERLAEVAREFAFFIDLAQRRN